MSRKNKQARNRGLEDSGELLFSWGLRRLRRWSLTFFILASLAVHAFGLYLFRVVQTGGDKKLKPPPQEITLLIGNTEETSNLLRELSARSSGFRGSLREVPFQVDISAYGGQFESGIANYEPRLAAWGSENEGGYLTLGRTGEVVLPLLREEGNEEIPIPPEKVMGKLVPQFQFGSADLAKRSPKMRVDWGQRLQPESGELPTVRLYVGVGRNGRVEACLPAEESNRKLAAEMSQYLAARRFVPDPSAEALEWTWVDVIWKVSPESSEGTGKPTTDGGASS